MEVKRGEDSDEGVNILYIILWKPMADSDDDVISEVGGETNCGR